MGINLSQQELKEICHYNPDTGVFTRKKMLSGRAPLGKPMDRKRADGYLRTNIHRKEYTLHRLAFLYMTGELPTNQVDHINHDKQDNRWSNLRPVTHKENHQNMPLSATTNGVFGVNWIKQYKKWRAGIRVNGEMHHLGMFQTLADAISARKEAENHYGFHPNHGNRSI